MNKNTLLALLALCLGAAWWWQSSHILNCEANAAAVDSTINIAPAPIDTVAAIDTVAVADTVLPTIATGTTEDDLAKGQKFETLFKPMDLYFKVNDANYIKTDANQKFLAEAKTYLSQNKGKKLSLTGHTDSDGDENANQGLSEKRAADVKKQLAKYGIAADQISTVAKGETEPKADNATVEGKRANRRVAIVVE